MDLRILRDTIYLYWIGRTIKHFKSRGGKVVVITGSYGKTSVRELLSDLLRQKYQILSTSRNYNTAVGIAKTLRWEMTDRVEILILEVGAYRVGEISQFCKPLKPDIGVITGIARQHLSRFGSWEKLKSAKTEISRYVNKAKGILIANGSDTTVRELISEASWYQGDNREEINKNGAKTIAKAVGMNPTEIHEAEKYFRPVPSRFEITNDRYGMKVIDDSYNSNDKSFVDALGYLGRLKKCMRILVTPGLVELGSESDKIHTQLGEKIIGNADIVILVGRNERTKYLAKGIDGKVKIYWIDKTLDFMELVNKLELTKEPIVLLENDVPENY